MPILDPSSVEFFSRSPEQTRRVGMRLGTLLARGDVVCLSGELGTGKTTLVQGIAKGFGSLDQVTSPTFIIVNCYRRPDQVNVCHMDAYRLNSDAEARELDIDLMLEGGCLVVEWPERILDALPQEHLWITLEWLTEEHRRMTFHPRGAEYEKMLDELRQQAFGGY